MVLVPDHKLEDPKLFILDDDTNGTRYFKTAGGIVRTSLKKKKRNIVLPARFGGGTVNVTLAESWAAFGISIVLLSLGLGEVATNKDAILPVFKRLMRLIRDESLSLQN